MPTATANGIDLSYVESGKGRQTVVFAHGLLFDQHMFEAQRHALEDRYRVIAYDHRGQGASAPAAGGYDLDTLTEDAVDLLRGTQCVPCHFVGLSMGGFVALRLAARYPELLRSLTLLSTSASAEPLLRRIRYRMMQAVFGLFGPAPLIGSLLPVMFGPSFRTDPARRAELERWIHHVQSLPRRIVGPVGGVIGRASVRAELKYIRCPTLVLVGDEDRTTPPEEAELLAREIHGARLVRLPRCGHNSAIEAPEAVARAIGEFLVGVDALEAAA
ncbi:MAG: alpha/beta fold hydrolase [Xanthomonadales bacterium]|nr:3-oxoadipate enol-lactonase 2 [Xanthomonadales bacterium]MCC6592618.1 alpha/beta fold hydrolase [Xanthomonadales bacterium]MCE7931958.1 alpha/beta fold hydrolase [Xanthomonadales bacterium PRO6]